MHLECGGQDSLLVWWTQETRFTSGGVDKLYTSGRRQSYAFRLHFCWTLLALKLCSNRIMKVAYLFASSFRRTTKFCSCCACFVFFGWNNYGTYFLGSLLLRLHADLHFAYSMTHSSSILLVRFSDLNTMRSAVGMHGHRQNMNAHLQPNQDARFCLWKSVCPVPMYLRSTMMFIFRCIIFSSVRSSQYVFLPQWRMFGKSRFVACGPRLNIWHSQSKNVHNRRYKLARVCFSV